MFIPEVRLKTAFFQDDSLSFFTKLSIFTKNCKINCKYIMSTTYDCPAFLSLSQRLKGWISIYEESFFFFCYRSRWAELHVYNYSWRGILFLFTRTEGEISQTNSLLYFYSSHLSSTTYLPQTKCYIKYNASSLKLMLQEARWQLKFPSCSLFSGNWVSLETLKLKFASSCSWVIFRRLQTL